MCLMHVLLVSDCTDPASDAWIRQLHVHRAEAQVATFLYPLCFSLFPLAWISGTTVRMINMYGNWHDTLWQQSVSLTARSPHGGHVDGGRLSRTLEAASIVMPLVLAWGLGSAVRALQQTGIHVL
jgi:hypothetical protein